MFPRSGTRFAFIGRLGTRSPTSPNRVIETTMLAEIQSPTPRAQRLLSRMCQSGALLRGQPREHGTLATESSVVDADSQLATHVGEAMKSCGYCQKGVSVSVENGIVLLSGKVGSWHLKQVAQEVVLKITGPGRVSNALTVSYPT